MTTYIVKDKDGREVWRDEPYEGSDGYAATALRCAYSQIGKGIVDLMLAAGYTVEEEAPEMIEVPVKDLVEAIEEYYSNGREQARDRLRFLIQKHRSGK